MFRLRYNMMSCIYLECKPGWYGEGCKQQCSGNCKIAPCNHVTGHCDGGCTSGWNGTFCLEGDAKSFRSLIPLRKCSNKFSRYYKNVLHNSLNFNTPLGILFMNQKLNTAC